jgi:hypothetical protein
MSNLITNLKDTNISTFTLLIVVLVALGVIFFLFSLTLFYAKKVRQLSRPRFGFGGKPLFSFLLVIGLVVAIPLTLYASYSSIEYIQYAQSEKDAIVNIDVEKIEDRHEITFYAIPLVEGNPWGDKTYTITWMIEGPVSFEKIEEDRTKDHISYFTKSLPPGTYRVSVTIENPNFNIEKYQELIVE